MAQWADLLYACDSNWWEEYRSPLDDGLSWKDFGGLKVTQDARVKDPGVIRVPSRNKTGLSVDPLCIHQGSNSGYQAINLAFHLGASSIALLGYDMQYSGSLSHWHGDHPGKMNNPTMIDSWVQGFNQLATDCESAGLRVTNCSRKTALECFERDSIDRWIKQLPA